MASLPIVFIALCIIRLSSHSTILKRNIELNSRGYWVLFRARILTPLYDMLRDIYDNMIRIPDKTSDNGIQLRILKLRFLEKYTFSCSRPEGRQENVKN